MRIGPQVGNTHMANSRYFWKLISRSYVASPIGDEAAYKRKLALTQERLKPDWEALEIACGSGNTALAHAPFVAHITATDFCGPMMDHGRARAKDEGMDLITFDEKRFEDINTDKTYDAVLMNSFIHLMRDWKATVRKASELTRAKGIFVSSTVSTESMGLAAKALLAVMRVLPVLPYVASISQEALTREIEAKRL